MVSFELKTSDLAKKALKRTEEALDLTREALEVARKEFDAVTEDLKYTREQAAIMNRTSRPSLCHNEARGQSLSSVFSTSEPEYELEVELWLFNDGAKTVRDATIFLWLPSSWRPTAWNGTGFPEQAFRDLGLNLNSIAIIDGKSYWYVTLDVPFPTYPGIQRRVHRSELVMPADEQYNLLWRVGCDDGMFPPQEEPRGRLNRSVMRYSTVRKLEAKEGRSPPPLGPSQS